MIYGRPASTSGQTGPWPGPPEVNIWLIFPFRRKQNSCLYVKMRTNLSIRQLQTFAEVMRVGSISEAARSLGRTQPAVSSTISGLEREIGFALFEREKKRLVPKPEAHYFLEEAEAVLKRLTKAGRTIQQVAVQPDRILLFHAPFAGRVPSRQAKR